MKPVSPSTRYWRRKHPAASTIANDIPSAMLRLPDSTIVADACKRYGCHPETARAAVGIARSNNA